MENKLKSRLLYLPLFTPKKIYLWLTYKGIKPASIIPLTRETGPVTEAHEKRIIKWIEDAGLFYLQENKLGKKLIISKDKKRIEEISKMKSPLSNRDQFKLGTLLGYPPEAAHAYGYDFENIAKFSDIKPSLKKTPAYKYLGYLVRKDHQEKDFEVAKTWMQTLRHDVPKLAKIFEKI